MAATLAGEDQEETRCFARIKNVPHRPTILFPQPSTEKFLVLVTNNLY
jgi:hypothetical protein